MWAIDTSNYYIDADKGVDANSGYSIFDPLASLDSINTAGITLQAGDSVLFRTGDIWREQLTAPASGSAGLPITFTKYDSTGESGADPIISGADLVTTWVYPFVAASSGTEELSDNFDDNDISDWGIAGTVVAQNQRIEIDADAGGGADKIYQSITARTEYWMSFDFYLASGHSSSNGNDIQGWQLFDVFGVGITNVSGVIKWQAGYKDDAATVYVDDALGPTDNTWHNIVLYFKNATASDSDDGIRRAWVDNVLIYEKTDVDDSTKTNNDCALGNNNSPSTFIATIYCDNVKVGTTGSVPSGVENKYYSLGISTEPKQVFINGTRGIFASISGNVGADSTVFWTTAGDDSLFIYTTTPSDTSNIEASQRNACVAMSSKNYITIDGIHTKYSNSNIIAVVAGQNNIIQNCTATGGYKGIIGYGETVDLTISDNTITNTAESGITTWISSYDFTISGLTIDNNTITNSGLYGIDIYRADSSSNVLIENNIISGAGLAKIGQNGIGFNMDGDTYIGTGIIRYNSISGVSAFGGTTDGAGIMVDTDADDFNVYYNLSYSNHGAGITTWQSDGVKIYNNVCYDNGNTGNVVYRGGITVGGIGGGNALIKNNICLDNVINISVDADVTTTNLVSDYNVFYPDGATTFNWKGTDYTFANWKTNSSQDANSLSSDPLFTNAAGDDFTLTSLSPAINAGVSVGLVLDYAGNTVPFEVLPDIGAYEYQLSTSTGYQVRFRCFPDFPKYKRH